MTVTQEVVGLGWLGWAGSSNMYGPHILEFFNDMGGIQQIACAERCLLALTRTGRVYSMFYSSDTQVTFWQILARFCLHMWSLRYMNIYEVLEVTHIFSVQIPCILFFFFVPLPQHTISHLQMFFLLVTTACGRVRWQRGYPSGCSFWWQTLPGPHLWWRSLLLGKWWWRSSWAWRQHVSFFFLHCLRLYFQNNPLLLRSRFYMILLENICAI